MKVRFLLERIMFLSILCLPLVASDNLLVTFKAVSVLVLVIVVCLFGINLIDS